MNSLSAFRLIHRGAPLTGLCFSLALSVTTSIAAPGAGSLPTPPQIDPQIVRDQDDMTWEDYKPIPGVNWVDSAREPGRTIRIALVAADFEDQPFVMTLPKGSDLFGNPQIDPIPRADVAKFYADFWNKAQPLNHNHTVSEYWMELSHGRIGVQFEPYGPYRMPKRMIDYPEAAGGGTGNRRGGGGGGRAGAATADATAARGEATNIVATGGEGTNNAAPPGRGRGGGGRGGLVGDLDALWRPDAGDKTYDLVLRVYAGYDETSVWQEFGEMKFQTKEDITPEWGNPDPSLPRWSRSRYVEWTSWKAASYLWSNSSIINGECSGSIRHEISHAAFRIGDNNNNPYVTPYRRCAAGPWDVMDRGSFNGPGGPHNRFQIPVTQGGSMPAGLMLRQQISFGFVTNSNILRLNRDGLAQSGLAVADVIARCVDPGSNLLVGVTVKLDGEAPQDRTPKDDPATNPLSSGNPDYNFYSLEVVQRIGYDSFCPDSGVLLAKNKDRASAVGGPNSFNCFNWTIDAHPEDINKLDFKRPNGEPVMRTIADYRQLNDALFHAGLNSGSQYEWEDTPNRLHFYIVNVHKDSRGILSYTVAVRSLDGAGPQKRGFTLASPGNQTLSGTSATYAFKVNNTGATAATDASLHPQDATAWLNHDVYRLSASVEGRGWSAQLLNALAAVKFGEAAAAPVFVARAPDAARTATVTLKAQSESDPSKTATVKCTISAR